MYSLEQIKALGKEHSESNLRRLIDEFARPAPIEIRREIISSIGRQDDNDKIFAFMQREAFNDSNPMELIYQIFRTCLYKGKSDSRFAKLKREIMSHFQNENIDKMNDFYEFRQQRKNIPAHKKIFSPILLAGDSSETLKTLPEKCIQLAFTSPPYYNAREYSDYKSYSQYLEKMKSVFVACNRVIEDGRFFIVNVSPVITKRAGREFESIRYPIHYDFHKILLESGFYFIDEIIWIKPEP